MRGKYGAYIIISSMTIRN